LRAKTAATPAEAAKDKEAVWVCVSDTKAVQNVLFVPVAPWKAFPVGPSFLIPSPSRLQPAAFYGRPAEKAVIS